MTRRRRCGGGGGFTLVEAMAVVGLIGVLATLSIGYAVPMMRRRTFATLVRNVVTALNQARFNALRSGRRTAVTLENNHVVAFFDNNNNRVFDDGEPVIYSFPADVHQGLDPGFSVHSETFRERGYGPLTAVFDARGFYIDAHDGSARHIANICVKDAQEGQQANVLLDLFGRVSVSSPTCQPQQGCPNVAPE